MRYAITNPEHGKEVGWRLIGDQDEINPGEMTVSTDPTGKVWDEVEQRPRPRTSAENLEELRDSKYREIRQAAFAEQDTYLAPGYEDRDYIHIILAVMQNKPDPRQNALIDIKTKLDTKIGQINAATTEAEVEAISW